jgi:hypothetical protein
MAKQQVCLGPSPYVLVGTVDQTVADLEARRELFWAFGGTWDGGAAGQQLARIQPKAASTREPLCLLDPRTH